MPISDANSCPCCASRFCACVECGKVFSSGTASHCDEPECAAQNAPLDCMCGRVVCDDRSGVLDFNGELLPWVPVEDY